MQNLQNFKLEHEYAVVMASRGRQLHVGMNAVINGLDLHGNEVDLFLMHGPDEIPYLEKLKGVPDLKVRVIPVHIDECREMWPDYKKDEGWQNAFFRYKIMGMVGQRYRSVMMVDSDMFCCNNIMKYFKIAADTGLIVLPTNPWGCSVEDCRENWAQICTGASAPPFHCMPLFLDAKKWSGFLDKVWVRGLYEPYLDMEMLNRVFFAENVLDQIFALPNILWVHTSWYYDMVKKHQADGKVYFMAAEERINFVHRRWWITGVCQQFLDAIDKERCPDCYKKGVNNVKLFWEEYKRLSQTFKLKIDYDFKWVEGHQS